MHLLVVKLSCSNMLTIIFALNTVEYSSTQGFYWILLIILFFVCPFVFKLSMLDFSTIGSNIHYGQLVYIGHLSPELLHHKPTIYRAPEWQHVKWWKTRTTLQLCTGRTWCTVLLFPSLLLVVISQLLEIRLRKISFGLTCLQAF